MTSATSGVETDFNAAYWWRRRPSLPRYYRGTEYYDEHGCVFVCPHAQIENWTSELHQISCAHYSGNGWVVLWWRCNYVMYFRFCGWRKTCFL